MSGIPDGLLRTTRSRRCPICGKPDWCLIAQDGSRAICQRVESAKRAGDAGWVHQLHASASVARHRPTVAIEMRGRDFGLYAAEARGFRRSDGSDGLLWLQNDTGVSVASLQRLGVGHNSWAWTFPMRSPSGAVIGIRLRRANGSKLSVKGSREGLFIPDGLRWAGTLLVVEGATDTAAALDLGFDAIGRPSCNGGSRWVVDLVRDRRCLEVVVIADADGPGRQGATRLALTLAPYAHVRIVEPPQGIKDLRDWLRAGCTHAALQAAIDASPRVRVQIGVTP